MQVPYFHPATIPPEFKYYPAKNTRYHNHSFGIDHPERVPVTAAITAELFYGPVGM
jgi:hypothetical protein